MAAGAGRNTGSRVQVIGRAWPKWRLATAGGSVTAEQVVVATDAYSEAPWSGLRSEQVRLPYFNFATEPLSDDLQRKILPERQGAWDPKSVLSSFRLDQTGRLVLDRKSTRLNSSH